MGQPIGGFRGRGHSVVLASQTGANMLLKLPDTNEDRESRGGHGQRAGRATCFECEASEKCSLAAAGIADDDDALPGKRLFEGHATLWIR